MKKSTKQLSNSFSTGGGGGHFEAHVQALFVALMLTGRFAPCLPHWPIKKIKLQGKFFGYDVDDMIVIIEHPSNDQQRKLIAQIKHSISITKSNKNFGEVIQAAWNNFNNPNFIKGKDVIALITSHLTSSNLTSVRPLLECARYSENSNEFINKVGLANFSSDGQRDKLKVFKEHLKNANNGNDVSESELFEFLRHFHLLGYDLDIKVGVTLSLLHSLISQYSQGNVFSLWARLVDEVQSANKNAGTITIEMLPEDLQVNFKQQSYEVIPAHLVENKLSDTKPEWNQLPYASDLVIANLLGAWNEKNDADLEVVSELSNEKSVTWISKFREILLKSESPIVLKNGKWRVTERLSLWLALVPRIFDNHLEVFKQCVVTVLTERHPRFDLQPEDRYAAAIYSKVFKHSSELRQGLAESLALIGSYSKDLINCSQNNPEIIITSAIREIFTNADWILWASLNNLLPLLAEAAPNEFLKIVENALGESPCPFDMLLAHEGKEVISENHMSGLLQSLEMLAWEEQFLSRVTTILGELASHSSGSGSSNRADNSLTTIFLPWFPQTTASIAKRKIAVQILKGEVPDVAFRLLLNLLPNQSRVSHGSHKFIWRNTIPQDLKQEVTSTEYWEQIALYADLAADMAISDIAKLSELVGHLSELPPPAYNKILIYLSSGAISAMVENERLELWTALTEFISKHKRFAGSKWAQLPDEVARVEGIANMLAPANPLNLYRRLFSGRDLDLYEENNNWEEQRNSLEVRRQLAIKEIMNFDGINAVMIFAESVQLPFYVGISLGVIAENEIDSVILPDLLGHVNKKYSEFAVGYIRGRYHSKSWVWVDGIPSASWSHLQIGIFLASLPFTAEVWGRAYTLLGDSEGEYWKHTTVNPYQANGDFGVAIDKLVEYGRPKAAIECLNKMVYDKHPLDKERSVKTLLAAVNSSEPSSSMDTYHIVEIIKALQHEASISPEDMYQIEWAYLPLLDGEEGITPQFLENRLASDSSFFCEVIQLLYRSRKGGKSKKKPTEQAKRLAMNAYRLLDNWQTPPGLQADGGVLKIKFMQWFDDTKKECMESGHLEVALTHIGKVLMYSPSEPEGLWIDRLIAEVLNAKDAEEMRSGFCTQVFNSRGAHWVDPTGMPERELAAQYRKKAEDVENAGYQRFAHSLREVAESYDRAADRIIDQHKVNVRAMTSY